MNFISFLSSTLTAPSDLWTIIINWINGAVGSYGWTILLFTLLVKVVMSPFDFFSKYSSKKQMLVQQKCAPQIAKMQKKFGNDTQKIRIQTNELYKREGMNMGMSCIFMLVNLVLTMTVFFTLYSSLRKVSAYEAINAYEQVQATYNNSLYENLASLSDDLDSVEEAEVWYANFTEAKAFVESNDDTAEGYSVYYQTYQDGTSLAESAIAQTNETAIDACMETWESVKSSWLWIDNIWVADSTTSPFPTYDSLVSLAKNGGYTDYVSENIDEESYTNIYNIISANSSRANNGYYILAILAGVLTFLTQWIAELHNKLKNKKANKVAKNTDSTAGTMKIMKFVMPVIMVIFVFSTGASFGIYILASNLASMVLGEISTLIIDKLTKKKRLEVEEYLEKEANRLIKKGKLQE